MSNQHPHQKENEKLPDLIRDFCYTEQRFTMWVRQREVFKDHTREGVYSCACCDIERNYAVKGDTLKELRI